MGDCTIVYPDLSRAIALLSRQPLFFLLNGFLKIPRYQLCNRSQKPTSQGINSKGLFNRRHLQKGVDQHAESSVRKAVRIVEYLVGKSVTLQRHSQDLFIELVGSVNALLTPCQLYRIPRAFSHTYSTAKTYALIDFCGRLSLLDALYGAGINTTTTVFTLLRIAPRHKAGGNHRCAQFVLPHCIEHTATATAAVTDIPGFRFNVIRTLNHAVQLAVVYYVHSLCCGDFPALPGAKCRISRVWITADAQNGTSYTNPRRDKSRCTMY